MAIIGELLKELVYESMSFITSADKAYSYLREHGYDVKRADVRQSWRDVGRETYWSRVITGYGTERKVPEFWKVETERKLSMQYNYIFDIQLKDVETGELRTQRIGFLSDERLSYDDVIQEATDIVEKYEKLFWSYLVDWNVVGVTKRKEKV